MHRPNGKPKTAKVFSQRPTPLKSDKRDLHDDAEHLAEDAHDPDVVVPNIAGGGPSLDVDADDIGVASALTDLANNYIKSHEAPVDGGDRRPGQTAKI